MKVLTALLGVVMLAVIGVAVFAMLNLRTLISAHQDQLVARVERVIGRSITVGAVVPSWWPLGVRLRKVSVGEDVRFGVEPFLVADSVVMAVRPWPLVYGRIEAAGAVLDQPRLMLVRNGEGRWNTASLGEAAVLGDTVNEPGQKKDRGLSLRVPLEWVVGVTLSTIDDGTIVIDDRPGRNQIAAQRIVLHHVHLRAEDLHLGSTARVRVDAAVFTSDVPDLHLDLRLADLGQTDLEHAPFTARLELFAADLGAVSGWLRRPGFAAGRVQRVVVDASGTAERWRGSIELRAADPELRIGGVPIGEVGPIALQAQVERERPTVRIEDLGATLGPLTLRARGDWTIDPWRVALTIESESAGAVTLATDVRTPIQVSALDGRVTIDRNGAALEPLRFHVDGAPVDVRGWITGIDPPTLDVRVEGRPFDGTLAADLALESTGAARARVEVTELDLAPAVARLAPELRGRIEGRVAGAAAVTARLAEGALIAGSLAGSGTLTLHDGRLRDVNLPDLVVEQIESIPLMPRLVSARTRSRYADLFASRDTVIESASVPFAISRGRLSTEDARLDNPAYQITGKGWIDEAEELRFHGSVLLGAAVSQTLRDEVRAVKYLAADDGRITLPFVARGRLGKVRVEPDAKRLRARGLTALLGRSPGESKGGSGDGARSDRRGEAPLADQLIERLERLLRP